MQIKTVIQFLETVAPPSYQESYDNCGLLTGSADWECRGILCTLDTLESIVDEAIEKKCNLIVAHHPVIFSGIKKLNGKNYVERTVIKAIKNDIAIYAIHTSLDNVISGVNKRVADKIGLRNIQIIFPKRDILSKLVVYAPLPNAEGVRNAIFKAGAGYIGNYNECSFSAEGNGTFNPQENAKPFIGEFGKRETVREEKIEVIFPNYLQHKIVAAMKAAHPYEEVAYDILPLGNIHENVGSGIIGELNEETEETVFLKIIKQTFGLSVIRHTGLLNKKIKKVAVCGGAGSFLIRNAIAAGADFYITSDIKYHEFFDADNQIVIADIGHWESEQFTIDLLFDILVAKFPTFAVLKSALSTNPVQYFS